MNEIELFGGLLPVFCQLTLDGLGPRLGIFPRLRITLQSGLVVSNSQQRAARARSEGYFKSIVPVYNPVKGELTRIYGGEDNGATDFPSKTKIDIALLSNGQQVEVDGPFLFYITRGKGIANNKPVQDGDLIRGSSIKFEANEDVQLIVIHAG